MFTFIAITLALILGRAVHYAKHEMKSVNAFGSEKTFQEAGRHHEH